MDKLGKGIVLRELIAFHGCLICLFMPLLGYNIYNYDNYYARLWVRFMPVSKVTYFSYALPAMTAFTAAICWPISNRLGSDSGVSLQERLESIKDKLAQKPNMGLYLIGVGLFMFYMVNLIPDSLRYVAVLLYWSSFVGSLYVYYTRNFRYKIPVLLFFTGFVLLDAIRSGMFTVVAYMSITIFSFFFLNRKVAFWKKLTVFVVSSAMLLLIQSVKANYRKKTWRGNYAGSKVELFGELLSSKLNSSTVLFSEEAFFPIYYRVNQGYNVALVMRRMPIRAPHDGGSFLMVKIAASLVPRLLWPDKPEAGGKANMKYYANISIKGFATDVGPLGEAYGSFGVVGGVIYMLLLGFLIRFAYTRIFLIAQKIPLLILWIPVMFYQVTYSAENDTLQILNTLIKSGFFVFILYKTFPSLFKPVNKDLVVAN
ncbi:hypothetical protein FAM09_05225 [Niastella caeni]|uniref:Oligosaccharide repeat unit polymerase n=1 Tax=Niastella caeni TaxID=2569763 RepID=A0A4S8I0M7_9BACT|nr:hypothetical protein [Niastella caeni]THU41510.1 hypothetical protein FAM09_05225 [Niastella caeni]